MMALHNFARRFQRDFRVVSGKGLLDAGDVVLNWNSAAGPADANVEGDYSAPVLETLTLSALIHFVSARAVERNATMFAAGDAIVTFDGETTFDDKPGLYFVLPPDGLSYVQQSAGKEIAQFWDVFTGGVALTRTLLLRLR